VRTVVAIALDAALVVLFVAIGRRSHGEDEALAGFLTTLWPFIAGAALGWLLVGVSAAASRGRADAPRLRPFAVVPTGLVVWASAVVVGLLLRIVSGQGVQLSFAIVTTLVLAAFLLGWRGVALLVRRVRSRRSEVMRHP
jgi:hypothetical protein